MAGKRAAYSSAPAVMTSRAKKTAAMGVRNRPAKPAAMPVRSSCFPALGMGRRLPMECAKVPPIWTATPSRPALPPNRWVSQVLTMTRGMSRRGMSWVSP